MPENAPRSTAGRARKAVIPAAGLGTRFLPASKVVPKELAPVVDKPALQYIVEECAASGLSDVLLVTSRGKEAMADHFDRTPELEQALEAKGDPERIEQAMAPTRLATIHTVRQDAPRGLGHAVLCGAEHVGDEPFAVLLGDDMIGAGYPLLTKMIDVQARLGGCVVALLEVPMESIRLYGSAKVAETGETDVLRMDGLVEKPKPEEAPSNLAIIGRYVLPGAIFDVLRRTPPGRGGEIQLTDAIGLMAAEGQPVHGVVVRGPRYDVGDKLDYLKAVVQLAAEREDLGPDFRKWLAHYVNEEM